MSDIPIDRNLTDGLNEFAKQFEAQLDAGFDSQHEHNIHFLMGMGLQAAYSRPIGSIIFECRTVYDGGSRSVDIFFRPTETAIEVKYSRKSGHLPNPGAGTLGRILQDIQKLSQAVAKDRVFVLVADRLMEYIQRPQRNILPLVRGTTVYLDTERLERLPKSH